MSESDGEHAARSLALEQAYVHEVYEQCAASTVQSRHWPRIYQFLEDLEPGALVCDVGCGNGKYLNVKHSVFSVGVDRCKKLTDIAREKDNEVLVCDNLSLPFRDESFDAVLSIAVVHHFSTTERRVRALKELARVLRIGGRLIISVWAMEQKHRKFESQDVLIPWPKAYCFDSTSNPNRFPDKYNSCSSQTHGHVMSSQRRNQQKYRKKSYWVDPIYSPSPSTSSLSSPNETCYSFFRRALQKLAGGRRGSRAWFLENWQNSKGHKHFECEDADIENIPIELRRLDNSSVLIDKQNDNLSIKSKSLGDILEIQRLELVRSRSSIPGLCSTLTSDLYLHSQSTESFSSSSKPKLIKQKSHLNDDCLEITQNTAIQNVLSDLPGCQDLSEGFAKRGNVHKQNSMNEELMFIGRLKEKERVKLNIMKQTSLNEEIMRERTFDKFKDSFYYANATKRFQLLTSGLTNKIKQSTTSIEKVSGISIKNGFVKIFQSWKSTETQPEKQEESKLMPKRDEENLERRLSREEGSDSSKDSSLQSDTSVDSEDSFASVIFVPKPQSTQSPSITTSTLLIDSSAHPAFQLLSTASAPPSPRIKYPPELAGSKTKFVGVSPLLKQFPATSKSLPPSSPPGLSPHTISSAPLRPFFNYNTAKEAWNSDQSIRPTKNFLTHQSLSLDTKLENEEQVPQPEKVPEVEKETPSEVEKPLVEAVVKNTLSAESINEREIRKTRLNQIKELLKQKPEFATRTHKLSFPLVRRASSALPGRLETVTKVLPRLLSLELFNPETDDLDSDSSGVSSPESAGSVISVISDERYLYKKENNKKEEAATKSDNKCGPKLIPKVESPVTESKKTGKILSEESTWNDECRKHLIDVTEKLGENLIYDINQYCQKSQLEYSSLEESFSDKTRQLDNVGSSELEEISSLDSVKSCKYSASDSFKSDTGRSEDIKPRSHSLRNKKDLERRSTFDDNLYHQDLKKGKSLDEDKHYLRYRNSVESSDIGDSIENTISEGDSSTNMTGRTGNASTASLASSSIDFSSSSRSSNENRHQRHLERIPSRITELKNLERSLSGGSSATLSNSSSQESLSSDQEGAITYHQYYHVFREGELDQLINKYVENLHIISSYYDHASWCIVAEKVQVWTI